MTGNASEYVESPDTITTGRSHATVATLVLIVLVTVVAFLWVLDDHIATDGFFLFAGVRAAVTAHQVAIVT